MLVTELLSEVVSIWERQIALAKRRKEEQFGKTAAQIWSFKGKSYRDLYLEPDLAQRFSDARSPYYKARLNKTAEAISIFVPYCLSRVPERIVSPRRAPFPPELAAALPGAAASRAQIDQEDLLIANLLQWFLNYTPGEYGARREFRTALTEAFGKGSGVLWHGMEQAPAGLIPVSYFDSIDYYLIDPDVRQTRDAGYVIRECHEAAWRLSQRTGLPLEMFRGKGKSAHQAAIDPGGSDDLVTYYRIYSRAGIGHWLDGQDERLKPLAAALDSLGPNIYLEIMPGEPFPLNVRPVMLDEPDAITQLQQRLDWPIRFWADSAGNPWPCTRIDLLPNAENPWGTSPLESGLAMQIFLDHFYTFLMNRARISTAAVILASKELQEETINSLKTVRDLLVVTVDGHPGEDLQKLLAVFKFPELNKDTWPILEAAERAYENAVGLTPILYGNQGPTQIRTAHESQIREAHAITRPEDYADTVEDCLSDVAAKEAQAARMHVHPSTVANLAGEPMPEIDPDSGEVLGGYGPLTDAWMRLVHTEDELKAAAEFAYTVAAGSARRKNREKLSQDLQQMLSAGLLPAAQQIAMAGNVEPWNAVMDLMGEALDDRKRFQRMMLQPGQMIPQLGQQVGATAGAGGENAQL